MKKFFAGSDRVLTLSGYKRFDQLSNKDRVYIDKDSSCTLSVSHINLRTEGHRVAFTSGHHMFCNDELYFNESLLVHISLQSFNSAINSSKGDYALGYIIGHYSGDGTSSIKTYNGKKGVIEYIDVYLELWGSEIDQLQSFLRNSINNKCGTNYKWLCQPSTLTNKVRKNRIGGLRLYKYLTQYLKCDARSVKYIVPDTVFLSSKEFIKGFLRGIYDTDGSVNFYEREPFTKSSVYIGLVSTSVPKLKDIQILLQSFGIRSSLYFNRLKKGPRLCPDSKGNLKLYNCKATNELVINRPNSIAFERLIGFHLPSKQNQLKDSLDRRGRICKKEERFTTRIKTVKLEQTKCILIDRLPSTIFVNGLKLKF